MCRRAAALLALAGLLPLSACATGEPTAQPEASAPVAPTTSGTGIDETSAGVQRTQGVPEPGAEVDASTFAQAMARPETVVLDVRTPAEFAEGHLPGAVNLDVEGPGFAEQVAQLDPDVPYAVYCRSGNRSALALQEMLGAGITDAYHLGGGISAWAAAGGEIVSD